MNFTGTGAENTSNRRQHHPQHGGEGGNSFEEEDEEERRNMGPTGQLFPSSSSSSPSSHQYKNNPRQHQQPSLFHPQPPYLQPPRGGWMHGGGESSSRVADPMMVDYSSSAPVTPTDNNNDNNTNNDQQGMMMVEREHMFDKVVTPSDVGKLNRLVIPKQHAERYFPLDSSTNDKGLLLNFEDRNGKPWRFRYSYWNSSQSYVMTKGWSRFVKDKKLDAGDIVSFQRGVGGSAKDRLFIDWRHRPDAPVAPPYQLSSSNLSFPLSHNQFSLNRNNINPWNPLFLQSQPVQSRNHSNLMLQPSSYRYGNTGGPYHTIGTGSVVNVNQGGSGSVIYFRSSGGSDMNMIPLHQRNMGGTGTGIGMDIPIPIPPVAAPPAPQSELVFDSVPVVHGKAAAKRLRLFGVNMDCPISDDDEQDYDHPNEMVTSSTTAANSIPMGHYHHDHHPPTSSSTIPYLQLRPYEDEETQFHETAMTSSSSSDVFNKTTKSSSSRMSLDLDI